MVGRKKGKKIKIEMIDVPRDILMVLCQCHNKMVEIEEKSADGIVGIGWTISKMRCPSCGKIVSFVWKPHKME